MGNDGAKKMKLLKERGSLTFAQSKKTSVVFGMPKAAIEMDCVDHVCDLDSMANKIIVEINKKI